MAAAIRLITTTIAAVTPRTTMAIRLGPTGYAHLLHARLKPAGQALICTLAEVSLNPKEVA
jgi:hypothetical protein